MQANITFLISQLVATGFGEVVDFMSTWAVNVSLTSAALVCTIAAVLTPVKYARLDRATAMAAAMATPATAATTEPACAAAGVLSHPTG